MMSRFGRPVQKPILLAGLLLWLGWSLSAAVSTGSSSTSRSASTRLRQAAQEALVVGTEYGEPLTGITPTEFELFRIGLEDFLEVEDAEEGLGPTFNGRSCAECHSIPRVGGSGMMVGLRAGVRAEDGTYSDLAGGSLIQLFSIPSHEIQPFIPTEANVVARRIPLPVFGAGLVEAVPDEALLALQDPEDRDGDGISGRAHILVDPGQGRPRVGRFGWKAQQATLLAFGAEAYRDEMGITNDLFPEEACPPQVDCDLLAFIDPVPDPEDAPERTTGLRGIDNFANFMRLLGPPPRQPQTAVTRLGEQLFIEIGCASCHTPRLSTGADPVAALSFKTFAPYGNFLLHDIGTGDGIEQGEAGQGEIRTAPLWGVRHRAPFLHDGRAGTLRDAIEAHGGEAEAVRRRFEDLTAEQKQAVLEFLESL